MTTPEEPKIERKSTPHILMAWGGPMRNNEGAEVDTWSASLKLRFRDEVNGIVEPDYDLCRGYIGEIWPLLSEFHNTTSVISNAAELQWLKLNPVNEKSRYINQQETVEFRGAPVGGPANGGPWQVALAVTLRTAKSRGLGSSGRFYLPIGMQVPGTAGNPVQFPIIDGRGPYITTEFAQDVADKTAELIAGIRELSYVAQPDSNISTFLGDMEVWTVPNVDQGRYPTLDVRTVANKVTGVEVDKRPDTQRRRSQDVSRSTVSAVIDD